MSSVAGSATQKTILSVAEARDSLLADAMALGAEPVELDQALGRVTTVAVTAGADIPAFDNSAMDGFAVRAEDLLGAAPDEPVELKLVGESRAGMPWSGKLGPGHAAGISTGAMIPDGADTILRVEAVNASTGRIVVRGAVEPGQDIRRRAEVTRSGEVLIESGKRIGPVELGVLAAAGYGRVCCHRKPRVTLLTTGDELVEAGTRLKPGQIWNTNSHVISALVREAGGEVIRAETVPDRRDSMSDALKRAFDSDIVLICGGVSVGKHDHVRPGLAELGVEQRFWGIALSPGRPACYGTRGDTKVVGLPGNPVSALVVFRLLVDPAIRAHCGEREHSVRTTGRLAVPLKRFLSKLRAVPCRVTVDQTEGDLLPVTQLGSHDFIALRSARLFALIPPGAGRSEAGEVVETMPLWAGSPN